MKSRLFFITAIFVFSTLSAYCSSLLSLVPYDAYLIVNFDCAAIVAQPEIKALIDTQLMSAMPEETDFYEAAGIKPTDIKNVMFFLDAQERSGILVNGSFSIAKMSEFIQSDPEISSKFIIGEIEGHQAIKNTINNADGNMIFVNENTIALGSEDILKNIAKLNDKRARNIMLNKAFLHLIERVETNSMLWGAVVTSSNKQTSTKIPIAGFQNMKTAFFAVNYGKDFSANFTGLVGKKSELPNFADAMMNALDAFRGWTVSAPEVAEIFKNTVVEDNGENLARIHVSIPADKFKTIMIKLGKRAALAKK